MDKTVGGALRLVRTPRWPASLARQSIPRRFRPAAVTAGAATQHMPQLFSTTFLRAADNKTSGGFSALRAGSGAPPPPTTTTTTETQGPALGRTKPPRPTTAQTAMAGLADLLSPRSAQSSSPAASATTAADTTSAHSQSILGGGDGLAELQRMQRDVDDSEGEYKFHIYARRKNTHVTVGKPNGDVILSVSCGNIGFRSANRKTYDAAYQLGAYVCDRLYQNGWHKSINKLAVFLRGHGPGREAVTKVLLGTEGRLLRGKITSVADSTRLKFGGTRSQNPRRL